MFLELGIVLNFEYCISFRPTQVLVPLQKTECCSDSRSNQLPSITMNAGIAKFVDSVAFFRQFIPIHAEIRYQGVESLLPCPCKRDKRICRWFWYRSTFEEMKDLIGKVQKMWSAKKFRIGRIRDHNFVDLVFHLFHFFGVIFFFCEEKLIHFLDRSWNLFDNSWALL